MQQIENATFWHFYVIVHKNAESSKLPQKMFSHNIF